MALAISTSTSAQTQGNPQPPDSPSVSRSRQPYQPITGKQRLHWLLDSTVGPRTLFVGILSSGLATAENSPKEYGPTWEGFGKRYGMRLTGTATSNTMEAGFGSIWGEDPRYYKTEGEPFKYRVRNVVAMTFMAHDRDGEIRPAYARFIAIPGSNFLSNTWRADSEATTSKALQRTLWGFLGTMGGNAFSEFWPDFHRRVLHNKF